MDGRVYANVMNEKSDIGPQANVVAGERTNTACRNYGGVRMMNTDPRDWSDMNVDETNQNELKNETAD